MRIGRFEVGLAKDAPPPQGEVAIGGTSLPGVKFHRYNPDTLIGRKGAQIYDEIARDDAAKGPLMFFKYATLARSFTFKVDTKGDKAAEQQKFADWAQEMMDSALVGTWVDKVLGVQTAHDYGFSLSEKVFAPWQYEGRTTWALVDLKLKPFHTFEFKTDDFGNVTDLQQQAGGRVISLPYDKFVHYVNRPDKDPQYGESDLRDAYRDWWIKDTLLKLWNIHLERHGSALPVAKTAGLTTPQMAQLKEVLEKGLGAGGAFIVPNGVDLQIYWPQGNAGYDKAIERCDQAMARILMMPSLLGMSAQQDTGSYSQAKVQQDTLEIYLDARAKRLADLLNEQLWRYLAVVNFGLEQPPKYVPEPMTEPQKVAVLSLWSDLLSKGAVKHNLDSENRCRELLGFPAREKGDEPTPPAVTALPGQGTVRPAPDSNGGEPLEDEARNKALPPKRKAEMSEFARRVNYARVNRWSEDEINRSMADVGSVLDAVWQNLVAQIERKKLGTRAAGTAIEDLEIPKALKSSLRRKVQDGLFRVWKLSADEARTEIKLPADFAQQAGLTKVSGEQFLKTKAFTATRRLLEDLLTLVQTELANGLKYDKSTREVVTSLKPLLEEWIPSVDSAGRAVNKAARLETIVRTNWWEAINESRHSFFTDPDLKGFVEALEYSAIMDDRTTEICASLDGKVYAADSPEWDSLRPPNHFNCRSLLIPVTALDKWEASAKTSVTPQKGFE